MSTEGFLSRLHSFPRKRIGRAPHGPSSPQTSTAPRISGIPDRKSPTGSLVGSRVGSPRSQDAAPGWARSRRTACNASRAMRVDGVTKRPPYSVGRRSELFDVALELRERLPVGGKLLVSIPESRPDVSPGETRGQEYALLI